MTTHSFDIEDAKKYGVNAAILLQNIEFWVAKNQVNNKHCYDGHHWTYNSVSAFEELFPYLGAKQIRYALEILEKAGVIKIGNYNNSPYDRTKWYTSTRIEKDSPFAKTQNGNSNFGEPIPDIKPDRKTYIMSSSKNPDSLSKDKELKHPQDVLILNKLNKSAGKNFKILESNLKEIRARLKEYTPEELERVIEYKVKQWKNDKEWNKYLRPSTLFNATKCAAYVEESREQRNGNNELAEIMGLR